MPKSKNPSTVVLESDTWWYAYRDKNCVLPRYDRISSKNIFVEHKTYASAAVVFTRMLLARICTMDQLLQIFSNNPFQNPYSRPSRGKTQKGQGLGWFDANNRELWAELAKITGKNIVPIPPALFKRDPFSLEQGYPTTVYYPNGTAIKVKEFKQREH